MTTPSCTTSKSMLWTGRVLSTLIILFMLFDAITKVVKIAPVVEATTRLGISEAVIRPIGLAALLGTVLYMFPPTAVLGAIILTGFLGGATATQVLTHQQGFLWMPILFGIITWLGLYFRDGRIRALIPLAQCRSTRAERSSTIPTAVPA
ncbi:MAG TPA: DoxX family protein [Tepidisphaeraceae bacterium]